MNDLERARRESAEMLGLNPDSCRQIRRGPRALPREQRPLSLHAARLAARGR